MESLREIWVKNIGNLALPKAKTGGKSDGASFGNLCKKKLMTARLLLLGVSPDDLSLLIHPFFGFFFKESLIIIFLFL